MKQIHIGEIIRQRRTELGMTQEELCEGICESPTMSRIENGKQTPSCSKLNALLGRLGLPSEKYYAMMSENELEIERLKVEILDCNTRGKSSEGLEKMGKLMALTDKDDHITHQFIARSRVLLGREEDGNILSYSTEEKLDILFKAIKMTISNFDLDEIGRHWYSLEELQIINQIGIVYGDNEQRRRAIDVYYQLMKYVKRRIVANSDNAPIISLVAYNYSLYLCLEKRYEEAYETACWGWEHSVSWGRVTNLGGFMYVLAESSYCMGKIEESKEYYYQSYYAYKLIKDHRRGEIIKRNMLEYYNEIP